MAESTLIVVHGSERMEREGIDRLMRDHLGAAEQLIISFPDVVAGNNNAAMIQISAYFYPDNPIENTFRELGDLVATHIKRPTLVLIENRHPTEQYRKTMVTIKHEQSVGRLRA